MQSNRRERLLAWATYQPRPLFWAARFLASLLPKDPETILRLAFAKLANGTVSPAQMAALQALIDDVRKSP